MKDRLQKCTITLNRACNLRCSWCYAKDTLFKSSDNMSMETFDNILKFCESSSLSRITLIGGEPTIYPHIFDCLEKLKKYKVSLVSNGVVFSNELLAKKYIEYGISCFSISIKETNRYDYKKITGFDKFEIVLQGIKNLISLGGKVTVSFVITESNIERIPEMVNKIKECGCDNFFFSFCRNYCDGKHLNSQIKGNPLELGRKFEELLPWLKNNVKKLHYTISDPLCCFTEEFIKNNLRDFFFPCYVHSDTAITFDTNGFVIPCNTLFKLNIGKIGYDFTDINGLNALKSSVEYKSIYKKLKGFPNERCKNCKLYLNCQGRCACNWSNYNFDYLMKLKMLDSRFVKSNDVLEFKKEYCERIIDDIEQINTKTLSGIPEKFRIIIGIEDYKTNKLHNATNINIMGMGTIYDRLTNGKVAFIPGNRSFPSSAINVLNLITCSPDVSFAILDYFGTKGTLDKVVIYLYLKGYLFLNLSYFTKGNVCNISSSASKILICGNRTTYKKKNLQTQYDALKKSVITNKIPCTLITHPSGLNQSNDGFADAWLYHKQNSKCVAKLAKKYGYIAYLNDFIL